MILFLMCLPLTFILYIVLSIHFKSNPLFFQIRPGRKGKLFNIIKFKSMTDKRGSEGKLLPDSQRLTNVGKFIRSASLDEIPQLWNIVKGDMSFVGPRPLLPEYLPLYNEVQKRRHDVKPGITGWAQVNGRNSISWEEKFNLDVWYVENQSFRLDIKIIWMTLLKVLKKDGVSSGTSVTMEKFKGTK